MPPFHRLSQSARALLKCKPFSQLTRSCGSITDLRSKVEEAIASNSLLFDKVTFERSTGTMLEWVAEKDSVLSRIRTIKELKKRLANGRRCYALRHKDFPAIPITFLHVALTHELAPSLSYLDEHCRETQDDSEGNFKPSCAMFYSVNAPHSELSGLDLAPLIIKLALQDLMQEIPSIHYYSTLSPIPRFNDWLSTDTVHSEEIVLSIPHNIMTALEETHDIMLNLCDDNDGNSSYKYTEEQVLAISDVSEMKQYVSHITSNTDAEWVKDVNLSQSLRLPMSYLCAYYLMYEKRTDGAPFDPVARFHLRNGAQLRRVNYLGNTSNIGLKRSSGMMVNYLYTAPELNEDTLKHRAQIFDDTYAFRVHNQVLSLLTGDEHID
jgi:malonyl-CoA decarboxylase